ncbi:MAG: hypothetical protein GDA52_09050 [Rhodobacteraceae bacterium]|nr:hypothetical protein [Paracoccaceae bacterium]
MNTKPGYGNIQPEADRGQPEADRGEFEPTSVRPGESRNATVQLRRLFHGLFMFRRGVWEVIASFLIAVGVVMLMQPFMLAAFTYSFIVILIGTVIFIIVSHFPD